MGKQNQQDEIQAQTGDQGLEKSKGLGQKELTEYKKDPHKLYLDINRARLEYTRATGIEPRYLILGFNLYTIFISYLKNITGLHTKLLPEAANYQYICDDMYVILINKTSYIDIAG